MDAQTKMVNPTVLNVIDLHSAAYRNAPKMIRACDAADWLDGLATVVPTQQLAAYALRLSLSYVVAARRLIPEQRKAVRHSLRPLVLPRSAHVLPPFTPYERLAGVVAEIGVTAALNALAAIEKAAA